MNLKNKYITVIGSLNYDILIKQQRLPTEGETYTADSVSYEGGGKGANQAVQSSKLGAPTYLIGKVGMDNFGDILIDKLEGFGVQTSLINRSNKSTGLGLVHVLNDGAVYATIVPGANFDIMQSDIDKIDDIILKSEIIMLQMEIPVPIVEYIIYKAKENNIYTILNAAPAKKISSAAIKHVNCFVVNETEASYYSSAHIYNIETAKEYSHKLSEMTEGIVIITLGEKGSLLCDKSGNTLIDPVKVENVVETTGAGDSYIGAFAYCKYIGLNDIDACKFATKASAFTVTKIGAQNSMPYINEI